MMPFSLLVKPVGGDCNLRCTYCFYRISWGQTLRDLHIDNIFCRMVANSFIL